jgi:serine/threonine protein kinase
LITERIGDAQPVSSALAAGALAESVWRAMGAAVARLHHAGVDHADLNAHNILLEGSGAVSVIDFDRGRLRAPSKAHAQDGAGSAGGAGMLGSWAARNLGRLRRSLVKISRGLPRGRYSERDWQWFLAGYRAVAGSEAA